MIHSVTDIWRHPLKSHGREALDSVTMIAGQTMPGDRVWAVAHDASKADGSQWAPCANFTRGAKAPQLMAPLMVRGGQRWVVQPGGIKIQGVG